MLKRERVMQRAHALCKRRRKAFPFKVGDIIEFSFQDDGSRQCRIDEIKGTFARCGNPPDPRAFTIGRREPPELWVNVAVVESITRAREQR